MSTSAMDVLLCADTSIGREEHSTTTSMSIANTSPFANASAGAEERSTSSGTSIIRASPFSAVPGELLLMILKYAITPDDPGAETLQDYLDRCAALKAVSKRFHQAMALIQAQNFLMFRPVHARALQGQLIPWSLTLNNTTAWKEQYWMWHQGVGYATTRGLNLAARCILRNTELPALRSLSLDLRVPRTGVLVDVPWTKVFAPHFVNAAFILTRVLDSCTSLEELNVRLPSQSHIIRLVQRIISRNASLRLVEVEVDSDDVWRVEDMPTFQLQSIVQQGVNYAALDRLIIRAPTTIISSGTRGDDDYELLLSRLKMVKELALIGYKLQAPTSPITWLGLTLSSTPEVGACQFSFEEDDIREDVDLQMADFDYLFRRIYLPHLTDLVIELRHFDTRLLHFFRAPNLYALMLRTLVPAQIWPQLPKHHFPSLFTVRLWTSGPSAFRLKALGIPYLHYAHALNRVHNFTRYRQGDFLAYIKPYCRGRYQRPGDLLQRGVPETLLPPRPTPRMLCQAAGCVDLDSDSDYSETSDATDSVPDHEFDWVSTSEDDSTPSDDFSSSDDFEDDGTDYPNPPTLSTPMTGTQELDPFQPASPVSLASHAGDNSDSLSVLGLDLPLNLLAQYEATTTPSSTFSLDSGSGPHSDLDSAVSHHAASSSFEPDYSTSSTHSSTFSLDSGSGPHSDLDSAVSHHAASSSSEPDHSTSSGPSSASSSALHSTNTSSANPSSSAGVRPTKRTRLL
ncbi:hypothetical protein OC835_004919 [Tilletia horrida]|nr:hypothetical protein OC835_004919 [Tilletia horrida]